MFQASAGFSRPPHAVGHEVRSEASAGPGGLAQKCSSNESIANFQGLTTGRGSGVFLYESDCPPPWGQHDFLIGGSRRRGGVLLPGILLNLLSVKFISVIEWQLYPSALCIVKLYMAVATLQHQTPSTYFNQIRR